MSKQVCVEVRGEAKIWQRMNVYIHVYLFDDQGTQQEFLQADNREQRTDPRLWVEVPAAAHEVVVCLYVVPQEYPVSRVVADSPPLKLTLEVRPAGEAKTPLHLQERLVNQWGGDQLIGLKIKLP